MRSLHERHIWDDGYRGERLKPWAAAINLALLSVFCWAGIAAGVRFILEAVQ